MPSMSAPPFERRKILLEPMLPTPQPWNTGVLWSTPSNMRKNSEKTLVPPMPSTAHYSLLCGSIVGRSSAESAFETTSEFDIKRVQSCGSHVWFLSTVGEQSIWFRFLPPRSGPLSFPHPRHLLSAPHCPQVVDLRCRPIRQRRRRRG